MIIIPSNAHIGYLGTRRHGKTTRLKFNLRTRGGNWLIYDVKREYNGFGVIVRSLDQFRRAIAGGASRIVFQPVTVDEEEFNELCRVVFEELRDLVLVIDEIQLVASKHKIPYWLKQVITVKGEDGVGVWGSSQLPQNVHNTFLDQAEAIYSQSLGGRASEHVADKMGGEIEARDLNVLPRYHTILWTDHAPIGQRVFWLDPVENG